MQSSPIYPALYENCEEKSRLALIYCPPSLDHESAIIHATPRVSYEITLAAAASGPALHAPLIVPLFKRRAMMANGLPIPSLANKECVNVR